MGDTDQRYRQDNHGFSKLCAIKRDTAGWRQCVAGETPDAIVSRVYGPQQFAIVTNGEIDGFSGLTTGAMLGVTGSGPIAVNGSPVVAKVVSTTNILVNIASFASSTSNYGAAIQALQAQDVILQAEIDNLAATKGDKTDFTYNPSQSVWDIDNGTPVIDFDLDPLPGQQVFAS